MLIMDHCYPAQYTGDITKPQRMELPNLITVRFQPDDKAPFDTVAGGRGSHLTDWLCQLLSSQLPAKCKVENCYNCKQIGDKLKKTGNIYFTMSCLKHHTNHFEPCNKEEEATEEIPLPHFDPGKMRNDFLVYYNKGGLQYRLFRLRSFYDGELVLVVLISE